MPIAEPYIFDACAILALLQREEGAAEVEELLVRPSEICLIHASNACEVYYQLYRQKGSEAADRLPAILEAYGLSIVSEISESSWRLAGAIKAEWRRVSLADCFALATAIERGGALVTADHHEMDKFVSALDCQIHFIR